MQEEAKARAGFGNHLRSLSSRIWKHLRLTVSSSSVDSLPLLIITAIATYLTLVNLGGPYIFHFIDTLWPLNPHEYLLALTYTWSPLNLGAYQFVNAYNIPLAAWLAALQWLGLTIPLQEFVTLTLLQAIGGIGFYKLLCKYVLDSDLASSRPIATFASLAYILNYYSLVVGWWDNVPGFFLLLAFAPPFLFSSLRFHEARLTHAGLPIRQMAIMGATGFLAFSTNVPFNLSLLALEILLPPILLAQTRLTSRKLVMFVSSYFVVAAVILAISMWWILPDYLQSVYLLSYISGNQSTAYNLSLFATSTSGFNIITVFTGFFQVEYPGYAHSSMANAIYYIVAGGTSLLIGVTVLLGLVVARKGIVRVKQLHLTASILVLSLLLLGVDSPLSALLEKFLTSSMIALQVLRNPFVSLGFAACFLIILAVAHGVQIMLEESPPAIAKILRLVARTRGNGSCSNLSSRERPNRLRRLKPAITISAAFALLLPLLAAGSPSLVGNALPGAPFESRMAIPPYEFEVATYLRNHLNHSYALLYPGGFIEQNWTHGYDGYDVLPSLLPNSFLIFDSGPGFVATSNPMLDEAYSLIASGQTHTVDFSGLLQRLGVSTIVIEGEIGGDYPFGFNPPPNYPLVLASLNATAGLSLSQLIGPDTVYTTVNATELVASATTSVSQSDLIGGTIVPQLNLTSLYENATHIETASAPAPSLLLGMSANGTGPIMNMSLKRQLDASPLNAPLRYLALPIVFNGAPIPIPISQYGSICVTFKTNSETAVTFAVVDVQNLSRLTEATFQKHLFVLGGAASNLGYGTVSLFPAFGADHYSTGNRFVTLIDNLRETMDGSQTGIAFYLLISMFPVHDNQGIRGVPLAQWPGNQTFSISSIILGNPYYAPPLKPPQPVSMSIPNGISLQNLTSQYVTASFLNSSLAPAHNFLPRRGTTTLNLTLNATTKEEIFSTPLGQPFGQGYPPTSFNGIPVDFSLTNYSFLSITFKTNRYAALTATLVTSRNLSALNSTTLLNHSLPIGGLGNNLGYGDPALFPTFGADHFYSPVGPTAMTQSLSLLPKPGNAQFADFLLFSIFPVAGNGTGIRGLPVSDWPDVQSVQVDSIQLSTYLVSGLPENLPPGFFGPASVLPWFGPNPFLPTTAIANGSVPSIIPSALIQIKSWTPVSVAIDLQLEHETSAPVFIIFKQNFASSWTISGSGIKSATHFEVDSSLNGFLVYFEPNITAVAAVVAFSGQTHYTAVLVFSFSLAAIVVLAVPATLLFRRLLPSAKAPPRCNHDG